MVDRSERPYDLEERTFHFAKNVRAFLKTIPYTIANVEDGRQLVRASGSVGANYIEANESLGKKDFKLHIRISRKESKESAYWLRLLDTDRKPDVESVRQALSQEAIELMRIMAAILRNSE
jgi:four helix bundle protein